MRMSRKERLRLEVFGRVKRGEITLVRAAKWLNLSERQARRYVNVALEQPDGVAVPERTAVFTVRLAPSLIGGLRERAGASGQTLSAVTAEAVRGYLAGAGQRGGGQAS